MTSLYYYDAHEYNLDEWEKNMSLSDNTTKTYRFDEIVCIFVDLGLHVFGYGLLLSAISISVNLVLMLLTAPLLMCLALLYNRDNTDARFHQMEKMMMKKKNY